MFLFFCTNITFFPARPSIIMKHINTPRWILFPLLSITGALSANENIQEVPLGNLNALQSIVIEGSKADLEWEITYPVHNFNETDAKVKVQFITCAIGPTWRIEFGTRIDGGAYQEFYHGVSEENSNYTLTPGTVVAENSVEAGQNIEFLARHERTQIDAGWVSSTDPTQAQQVIRLVKGDPVPNVPPVPGQRSVADILAPYSTNGVMTIGEDQQIILFEIYTDNINSVGFDIQDLVLLVSFEQLTPGLASED